ncbi:MAG: DUF5790 family protein [Halanaeroarchaeum sp.]
MSQSTLDDDLFGEAAEEIRDDVESHLTDARSALPAPEDVWTVEAENTLGMLNALHSALAADEARTHLRDAKKWYAMGDRADAFEDAGELESRIESVETAVERIEEVDEQVSELTTALPDLKSHLEETADDA